MAAPVYRCRLAPRRCPTSPDPGYCTEHPSIELLADPTPEPDADPPETGPGPPCAPPRDWGLRLVALDVTVPIPAAGLDIGRDQPRFSHLPGMAGLDQISRHHARLTWQGATLMIEDTGSTNGTFVDGAEITAPRPLTPANRLRLAADVDAELVDLDTEP